MSTKRDEIIDLEEVIDEDPSVHNKSRNGSASTHDDREAAASQDSGAQNLLSDELETGVVHTGEIEITELTSDKLDEITGGINQKRQPIDTGMVQNLIGTVINDRYRIEKAIGQGGMGVVFKAIHETLDRPVVLKVIRPSKVQNELARKRFEREAKRLCLLDHPNVVTIHDFGYHDDLGFLVMEYVDGITLSTYLKNKGPLSFGALAPILAELLKGLGAAHDAGIAHRDIKAANAMMCLKEKKVERIKLLDFGLAKLVTDSEDLTKKSELIGSMSAMAPERILGQEGDARVDIYAIGVLAYYLLCGEKPFQGDDVRVLYSHVHEPPPPLEERIPAHNKIPSTVIEWVNVCLAKDPDERPKDANQALEWLYSTVENREVFRLEDHPLYIDADGPGGLGPESESRSREVFLEEGTPSWTGRAPARRTMQGAKNAEKKSESSSRTKMIAIAVSVVALLAMVGGIVVFSSGSSDSGDNTAATGDDAAAVASDKSEDKSASKPSKADTKARVRAIMNQIRMASEEQRYGAAGEMLESIEKQLYQYPELLSEAANYRADIKKGQALLDARRYDEQHRLEKAIGAYRKVLNLDPSEKEVSARLSKLENSTYLMVESNTNATVYIDGKKVGATPYEGLLPAEKVDIKVTAPGYIEWTKTLSLVGGKRKSISANLSGRRVQRNQKRSTGGNSNSSSNTSGSDEESLDDDTLMKMDGI